MLECYDVSPENQGNYRMVISNSAGKALLKACFARKAAVLMGRREEGSEKDLLSTIPDEFDDLYIDGSPDFMAGVETVLEEYAADAPRAARAGDLRAVEANFAEIRDEWQADGELAKTLAGLVFEGRASLETRLMFEMIDADLKGADATGGEIS